MSQIKKSPLTMIASVGVVALLAAVAAWQFYLFASFRDARGISDAQNATGHLWVAICTALVACVAGIFVFSMFVRYDRANEMHIAS